MLTAGVTLGVVMGIRHDFSLAPVHAHINLVGWASLRLVRHRLQALSGHGAEPARRLALHPGRARGRAVPAGIALSMLYDQPLVAIVAALMWLAGTILFLIQMIALVHRPFTRPTLAAAE